MIGDLHNHSFFSDGESSPEDLVLKAVEMDLDCLALTDHDGIGGLERAAVKALEFSELSFLPGTELTLEYKTREVHLLWYGLDYHSDEIKDFFRKLRKQDTQRVKRIIKRVNQAGYDLDYEEMLNEGAYVGGGAIVYFTLMRNGLKDYTEEDWRKYESIYAKASKEDRKIFPLMSLKEGVDLVHKFGGIAVLAHPFWPGSFFNLKELDNILEELPLDGVEIFHPDNLKIPEQISELLDFCSRNQLLVTGGSDNHRPSVNSKMGEVLVEGEFLEQLLKRI